MSSTLLLRKRTLILISSQNRGNETTFLLISLFSWKTILWCQMFSRGQEKVGDPQSLPITKSFMFRIWLILSYKYHGAWRLCGAFFLKNPLLMIVKSRRSHVVPYIQNPIQIVKLFCWTTFQMFTTFYAQNIAEDSNDLKLDSILSLSPKS